MNKIKNNKILCLLAFLVMLLWGSLFPMVKLGYKEFQIDTSSVPNLLVFAGIRFSICGFVILLFSLCFNKKLPKLDSKKEWIGVISIGIIAVALHYGCTYIGLSATDSSKTALLKQSGMIIFICLSFLFDRSDKFSIKKIIAALFGIASIYFLSQESFSFNISIWEILIIVASLCTVFSNLICKKTNSSSNAIIITGYSELIGGIILLAIGFIFGGSFGVISLKAILIFVYIIIATIISYTLWYALVQKSALSYLFVIKLSEPIFTAVIGALILGEEVLKWQYLVSFACIFIAILIINFNFKKKETNEKQTCLEEKYEKN